MNVTRAGGAAATAGPASVPRGRPHEIVVPLRPNLARGVYEVRWREVDEDDGHVLSGSFSFGVGAGVRPPSAATTAGSNFRPGSAVARFLLLSGILLTFGSTVFRRLITRDEDRRGQALAVGALALAGTGALLELALEPSPLATRFGKLTLAGAVVAAAGAAAQTHRWRTRMGALAADVPALALVALPTLQGHAAAHGTAHALSIPADLIHVAAAAVWTGGVVSLVAVVPRALRGEATRRFTPLAAGAVAALGITGVLRAVGELNAVPQLWSTSYGRVLLVKTGLLAVPIAIAAWHRGTPSRRTLLTGELPVFAGLLVAVAVLTGLRPGVDYVRSGVAAGAGRAMLTEGAEAGDLAVGLRLTNDEARATVLGPEGPVSGARVTIAVSGRPATARPCGAGCYSVRTPGGGRPSSLVVRVERATRRAVTARFRVPAEWPPSSASEIVRRAASTFDALRTLTIVSRLASDANEGTTTIWKLHAPDRLSYRELRTGSAAVIVGNRRWDRTGAGKPWVESGQQPVEQPATPWPGPFRDARILGTTVVSGEEAWLVSFFDPVTPAWFTIAVDQASDRTRWVDMIATAHFMHEDYTGFNSPTPIEPPRR